MNLLHVGLEEKGSCALATTRYTDVFRFQYLLDMQQYFTLATVSEVLEGSPKYDTLQIKQNSNGLWDHQRASPKVNTGVYLTKVIILLL